ncbi:MAG TPA: mannitol dehydrogenase family protein [Roseateles sp.]|nr:mannitol dehydrogenase family protein [Roseateles sp.]
MEAQRLNPASLAVLPAGVDRPAYERAELQTGIVHLGIGAFMRAHLAPATEAAIAAGNDRSWGIAGVSLRSAETHAALAPQEGLYTLALRDAAGQRLQVLGCVTALLVAPEDPRAVLERIAAPATRIVSLTVTEKGYCHDPASGALRLDHPDIVHDLAHPEAPRSAPGYLLHGLALRRARGLGGVALLSLDNLPANGRLLRRALLSLADAQDPTLAAWIGAACSFPCSMVDRIVPRTTDADRDDVSAALGRRDAWPVVAEPFFDWAVEDDFVAGRPDWTRYGARCVAAAEPWEQLKLRMVNGTHSAIAYLGVLAGWPTVDAALAQAPLRRHLEKLMRAEIAPTLPALPGLDPTAYQAQLLQRFANPALAHRTLQIAMDGSQKIPQRWLNTLRDRLAAGASIERLALGLAAWLLYLGGVDEQGQRYRIDDPLAAELTRMPPVELLAYAPVFGDLAGRPALVDPVLAALETLRAHGVLATLEALP